MLEIYMEEVRDLMNPKSKGGLQIRQHPKRGFYGFSNNIFMCTVLSYEYLIIQIYFLRYNLILSLTIIDHITIYVFQSSFLGYS